MLTLQGVPGDVFVAGAAGDPHLLREQQLGHQEAHHTKLQQQTVRLI